MYVCVFVRAYTEGETGSVTKKGEVTMPKACWASAQGSGVAEKGRRQKGEYSCNLLESNKTKGCFPGGSE